LLLFDIYNIILTMEKPFKLSELFSKTDKITSNRDIVLNVLDELIERELVKCTECINDIDEYCEYVPKHLHLNKPA